MTKPRTAPADDRIPVVLGRREDLGPSDLLLELPPIPAHGPLAHGFACDCCGGRDPWASALGGIFVRIAQGELPRPGRLLAVMDDRGAARLAAVLGEDQLAAARFRLVMA